MRKLVTLLAIVIASLSLVASTASAAGGGGTVVLRGFACGVIDGNGNLFVTYNSRLTLYVNQQSAKVVMQCEGNGAGTGVPGLVKNFNYSNTGLECGVPFLGGTTDWNDKVGYSGNSQLTCTITFYGPAPDFSAESAAAGTAGLG
jgi:hypothetical protein